MTQPKDEEQLFNKGEIVLCYEPDSSKARVLYTSKVLAVTERRDEDGLRYYDYTIHFQGWRPSYDRAVRASVLVKDSEANRQLQRELAEAAKLQIRGDYSYKGTPDKQAAKKKRSGRGLGTYVESAPAEVPDSTASGGDQEMAPTQRTSARGSRYNRDNSGGRNDKKAAASAPNTPGESKTRGARSQPVEVIPPEILEPEDRVMLRISERLREYMEYDYNMVVKLGNQHALPARVPIVTILENFVKQRAVELAISIKQDSSRGRTTKKRNAIMEREIDRVMSKVLMIKEVVDGIRIYFEFHLDDHLLYKEEKDYTYNYLTDDNLRNVSIDLNRSYEFINPKCDTEMLSMDGTPVVQSKTNGCARIEYKAQLEKCLMYIMKSTGVSTAHAYDERTSPFVAAEKLPWEMRDFLNETFNFRLLSAESPPEKSMVFGAPHLARLMRELLACTCTENRSEGIFIAVKMPEFLNVSPMSNQKLVDLLAHFDSFINFLESHKEWFDKENYVHPSSPPEQLQPELLDSLLKGILS
ncbi:hypothetical protein KR018_001004 [Drosophila ironensis]|nr:hypothetical protein KR018_001004 [Drosophila ironensis]